MNTLLVKTPPNNETTGPPALWWAVIQQAASDLRHADESLALDALRFLKEDGLFLANNMFLIPLTEYREAVTSLVTDRHRVMTKRLRGF